MLETTHNNAIIQVKGNQQFLLENCQKTVHEQKPNDTSRQRTRRGGHRETRLVQVFQNLTSFSPSLTKQWGASLAAVIKVLRVRNDFYTQEKRWIKTTEESYYIATMAFSAKDAGQFIRQHWWIENKNHYVRDVTLHEDASRIRTNPDRMVRLRSFALNLLRDNREKNISHAVFENALSLSKVLKYRHIQ